MYWGADTSSRAAEHPLPPPIPPSSTDTSKSILKYPEYSNIRIFENTLASNLVFVSFSTFERNSSFETSRSKNSKILHWIHQLGWFCGGCTLSDIAVTLFLHSFCPAQCSSVRGVVATWKKRTWVSWLSKLCFGSKASEQLIKSSLGRKAVQWNNV